MGEGFAFANWVIRRWPICSQRIVVTPALNRALLKWWATGAR